MFTQRIQLAFVVCSFGTLLNAAFVQYPVRQCEQKTAKCLLVPSRDAPFQISGVITLSEPSTCDPYGDALTVNLKASGFPQIRANIIRLQGFHIHEFGDLSDGCASAGAHYNPFRMTHGGPRSSRRHVGDLGNFPIRADGTVDFTVRGIDANLSGPLSVTGRAIVVHAQQDDLGQGGNEESLRTGNAGARLACCVIGRARSTPRTPRYPYYNN